MRLWDAHVYEKWVVVGDPEGKSEEGMELYGVAFRASQNNLRTGDIVTPRHRWSRRPCTLPVRNAAKAGTAAGMRKRGSTRPRARPHPHLGCTTNTGSHHCINIPSACLSQAPLRNVALHFPGSAIQILYPAPHSSSSPSLPNLHGAFPSNPLAVDDCLASSTRSPEQ